MNECRKNSTKFSELSEKLQSLIDEKECIIGQIQNIQKQENDSINRLRSFNLFKRFILIWRHYNVNFTTYRGGSMKGNVAHSLTLSLPDCHKCFMSSKYY